MRKMARHETASTSQPPTKGPRAVVTPASPDHAPMARARSSGRKLESIMARLPGVSRAPAMPWRSRAATKSSTLGAAAHSTEAAVNRPAPQTKMRRRP